MVQYFFLLQQFLDRSVANLTDFLDLSEDVFEALEVLVDNPEEAFEGELFVLGHGAFGLSVVDVTDPHQVVVIKRLLAIVLLWLEQFQNKAVSWVRLNGHVS